MAASDRVTGLLLKQPHFTNPAFLLEKSEPSHFFRNFRGVSTMTKILFG